jgi:hypothetical protein
MSKERDEQLITKAAKMAITQRRPGAGLVHHSDILTGEAKVSRDDPPSDQVPAWVAKYQTFFSQMGLTIQQAAVVVPVALRVRPLTMMVPFWTTRGP